MSDPERRHRQGIQAYVQQAGVTLQAFSEGVNVEVHLEPALSVLTNLFDIAEVMQPT